MKGLLALPGTRVDAVSRHVPREGVRIREGRRWDPLAALGTLGFATAMYAGLSYTFPDLPRVWIGILLVLGAIFVNGLLTAFDMD
ncbi:MAG: hypothetical protein E6J77_20775 [Deltaproteobacteria bacterium]|nr:MAG: hypothetical protein E6J77_20775 [Deltaproteobacteria bacterium]